MRKIIVVAGATGNLGGKIINALIAKDAEVRVIVRLETDMEKIKDLEEKGVKVFQVDTTNILFICGGAFSGLEKVIDNRTESSGIGFGAAVKSKQNRDLTEVFKEVEPEDLIKFGLIPELVGRMPVVATLGELNEESLLQILTEPKNALVKQYSKLLSMEGVDLEIRPTALKAIARKALARKTGARGLRSILELALIDTMFDLPNSSNVERVVVEEATIDENKAPLLVYREVAKKA